MGEYTTQHGLRLVNVHEPEQCEGRPCVIHNPLDTYDRERLLWRDDRGFFDVICEHHIGHPSPEDALYLYSIGRCVAHGCCVARCCRTWLEGQETY